MEIRHQDYSVQITHIVQYKIIVITSMSIAPIQKKKKKKLVERKREGGGTDMSGDGGRGEGEGKEMTLEILYLKLGPAYSAHIHNVVHTYFRFLRDSRLSGL